MRRAVTIALALIALGASGVGANQLAPAPTDGPTHWREIAWPFPRDGWPAGRAFRCDGACEGVELYIRAKLGFCNCDRGVADDDEVDQVTDIDLISPRFVAMAPGEEARVGELRGRTRPYDLDMPDGARRAATGIALSRRCDLLVAVVQGAGEVVAVKHAALEFLETQEMKRWITAALDGR
ncbi:MULTISPECIES: hypothetical protein [unclassified Bradyrhizobium]|uniref:hypothetical protein n=1 Tax=unclassified Bradyrhizobium TaxID=2631580 RepID=UPI002479C866|nr:MULTISPECIES: hypothetical protein [unclassified Bradyrhizobium]WGR72627.1 hypothetical protein MTX24_06730 [Bradyrhizobium sp. ISRA426]WGR77460.1 hypothetical protein MTX21_31680 [Bradyrhizobium sp. ISRA430]WGR87866.1 hypothetical protein MTX25_06730 [Bradyrhizobium sp. ISRA432]